MEHSGGNTALVLQNMYTRHAPLTFCVLHAPACAHTRIVLQQMVLVAILLPLCWVGLWQVPHVYH